MNKQQSKESPAMQSGKSSTRKDDDTYPDARERFERAVDIAAATKPIHKPKKASD